MKKFLKKVVAMVGLYEAMLKKEEKTVQEVLINLDRTDLRKRPVNKWDRKFWELVPILYKYDFALDFLNRYGFVLETYFKVLSYADAQNIVFQLTLCEVDESFITGEKHCRYPNVLHVFLQNWDFRDEVKTQIKNDQEKEPIVRFYNSHVNLWAKNRELL